MVDWEDVKNESKGDYLKLAEGRTTLEIIGEPKKGQDGWENTKYKMLVFVNDDKSKPMKYDASPKIMDEIGKLFNHPATLSGKKFVIIRKGLNKDNTKYTVQEMGKEINQ